MSLIVRFDASFGVRVRERLPAVTWDAGSTAALLPIGLRFIAVGGRFASITGGRPVASSEAAA